MSEILETAGQYRVRLKMDPDGSASNPRETEANVTYALTVPNPRYLEIAECGPLVDGWDRIKERSDRVELFSRWARIFHGAVVQHHTPHQGPDSVWYILPEQIEEIGVTPEEALREEIQEYQEWAEGEVYEYVIEKAVKWRRTDDEDAEMTTWEDALPEDEDALSWGHIGYERAKQAALEAFAPYKKEAEESMA